MASCVDPAEHLTRPQALPGFHPGPHRFERETDGPGLEHHHAARGDAVGEHDPSGSGCDHRLPATGLEIEAPVCRQPIVWGGSERPNDHHGGYRWSRREGEHGHDLIDPETGGPREGIPEDL